MKKYEYLEIDYTAKGVVLLCPIKLFYNRHIEFDF